MASKVMVVDDEEIILRSISHILRAEGFEVIIASGVQEALSLLNKEELDFLISDIYMPDGSGFELANKVKGIFPKIKVALMTGCHSEMNALECIRCGADYYLTKPFSGEDLINMMDTLRALGKDSGGVELTDNLSGWYEFVIMSSDDSLIKLQSFLGALLRDRLDEDRFWDVHFAISELGRNAIEWGNRNNINRVVKISVGITDNGVAVKIEDEGNGFDVKEGMEKVERTTLSALEESRLNEGKRAGGLGVHLIKEIADRLIYSEKGNMVLIYFGLPQESGTSS